MGDANYCRGPIDTPLMNQSDSLRGDNMNWNLLALNRVGIASEVKSSSSSLGKETGTCLCDTDVSIGNIKLC